MKFSILSKPVLALAILLWIPFIASADICNPNDPDYDPDLCAAGGSGSGGPGGGTTGGAAAVPIDGGASILAFAGVAYARKRMKKAK